MIETVAHRHPLRSDMTVGHVFPGATVADIVAAAALRPDFGIPTVTLTRSGRSTIVPTDMWGRVRPRPGTRVDIMVRVEGPAVGALLASVVSVFAPTIAGGVFGLTAGTFGFKLATAAITVVGGLLVNALIPPAVQPSMKQDDPNFAITGASNAINRYGVYPSVLGRHLMYPPMTATGYSETVGEDIYWRGRYTFGHGPVALETLKIGTTPITEFEDIEIEFLNVDQARTSAAIAGLNDKVTAWRTGAEAMTLYPDNIAEDAYSVQLDQDVAVIRTTQANALRASVDISFQGLVNISPESGRKKSETREFRFRYRAAGASTWIDAGTEAFKGRTTALIRFTKEIVFGAADTYEIEVTRLTKDSELTHIQDTSFLSSIRSIRAGGIPSHDGIAEVAIRVRASEQINGRIDSLNAVVQQLAPIWDGTDWSAPQPVRHPAWVYARALMGGHLRRPVAEDRIDLAALKAWADEEPYWTCDYVVDQPSRVAEVLDIIAAAGRAKRALIDLQYSVIRDGADGPVRQVFTPRNSWGFRGALAFPKDVHGLRVRVVSEKLDWEQDEIEVYADGYSAATATEFETLELPGVVLTGADTDASTAWRLGRYHLAQSLQRFETFEFMADFEHLAINMGDKIQFAHDVVREGVGWGRIAAHTLSGGNLASLTLDERLPGVTGAHRLTVRGNDGARTVLNASTAGDGEWTVIGAVAAAGVADGNLVVVEETASETLELLVTGIYHEGDFTARITAVRAAPEVLDADTGTIPGYDPPPVTVLDRLPTPTALVAFSGQAAALVNANGSLSPRIGVELAPLNYPGGLALQLRVRWRHEADAAWTEGALQRYASTVFTDALDEGEDYKVELRTELADGKASAWVSAGTLTATASDVALPQPAGWAGITGGTTITLIGDPYPAAGFAFFRIYAATAASEDLTEIGTTTVPWFQYEVPAGSGYTRYKVAPVDQAGNEGTLTAFIDVLPNGFGEDQIGQDIWDRIDRETQEQLARRDALIDELSAQALEASLQGARDRAAVEGQLEERRIDLLAKLDGNTAALTQSLTTVVTDVAAISAAQLTLETDFDGFQATVTADYYTASETDGAIAASVTTVQTQVNGLSASVTSLISSTDGVENAAVLELNLNGHITGYQIFQDYQDGDPFGSVVFVSDEFKIAAPNNAGGPQTLFTAKGARTVEGQLLGAGVYMSAAYVEELTVDTLRLGYGAVTDVFSVQSGFYNNNDIWHEYTFNVPMAFAGDILIEGGAAYCEGGVNSSSDRSDCQVFIDGTEVYDRYGTGTPALTFHLGISGSKAVTAGTKQVKFRAKLTGFSNTVNGDPPRVQFRCTITQRYR